MTTEYEKRPPAPEEDDGRVEVLIFALRQIGDEGSMTALVGPFTDPIDIAFYGNPGAASDWVDRLAFALAHGDLACPGVDRFAAHVIASLGSCGHLRVRPAPGEDLVAATLRGLPKGFMLNRAWNEVHGTALPVVEDDPVYQQIIDHGIHDKFVEGLRMPLEALRAEFETRCRTSETLQRTMAASQLLTMLTGRDDVPSSLH